MKKIIIFLLLLIAISPAYAVNWLNLTANSGRSVQLDTDSIKQYKNYYLYNIKYKDDKFNEPLVVTMQSSIKSPFSARLKVYKESEYTSLNGDYENMTNNLTTSLEPVTFNSIVFVCYNKVKELELAKAVNSTVEQNFKN